MAGQTRNPQLPDAVASYLNKRAVPVPWRIQTPPNQVYDAAIVIPALAESATLPLTLDSLKLNSPALLERTLIVVVVNHHATAADAEKRDNRDTLESLPHWKQHYRLENLCWVDAASGCNELPAGQGVGLARKIGLDLALPHLYYRASDPLLICLDADTLVQADYLSALFRHFSNATAGGASIPFCHQAADTLHGQAAIDRYELFLRVYVLGLNCAASPYAFHTVGSAMACRVAAYIGAGGMNRRLAGEDFYFLQQVHKTAGVQTLSGTTVYPSPRSSQRVPFGTGRSVGDMLAEGEGRLLFYNPEVFRITGAWLECVQRSPSIDGATLLTLAGQIAPALCDFLRHAGFQDSWDNLRRHNREENRLLTAFHSWFDAFRTMKLIHHLSDNGLPRVTPEDGVTPVLVAAGYDCPPGMHEQLALLRSLQGA